MAKIPSSILLSLPEDQREEFEKRCSANADLFHKFALVFERKLEEHKKASKHSDKYSLSSWAYYQADSIGYQRAMEEVITLLKLKE